MPYRDSDIPQMLKAWGDVVVIAGVELPAAKDMEGVDDLVGHGTGGISATDIVVAVQTSALPAVPNRTALTVNGVNMRLRDQRLLGDGGLTELYCELV